VSVRAWDIAREHLDGLSSSEIAVVRVICDHADDHGVCWAGIGRADSPGRLVRDSGLSRRSAQRAKRALVDRGLIRVVPVAAPRKSPYLALQLPGLSGDLADAIARRGIACLGAPTVRTEPASRCANRASSVRQSDEFGAPSGRSRCATVTPEPLVKPLAESLDGPVSSARPVHLEENEKGQVGNGSSPHKPHWADAVPPSEEQLAALHEQAERLGMPVLAQAPKTAEDAGHVLAACS
jgi:Helix-turn-helix domain